MAAKKYMDNDAKEERLIKKVMAESGATKSGAIAILKSKGALKQKRKKLLIKKKVKR